MFFLFPVIGFLYFIYSNNLLSNKYVPLYLGGLLVFSLIGFITLRNMFDKIANISEKITGNLASNLSEDKLRSSTDELQYIVESFTSIQEQFGSTFKRLEKKASDISILKELSELCYVTFDTQELLSITLERALLLTGSDMGSVLALEDNSQREFVVRASIGLGEYIKLGDRIDFDTSIAKYAVINKSPLLVEDVEKDRRFGRANLDHYGTKSFICLPVKTSNDIIGVLTLSNKENQRIYTQEDVETLIPLLSNAAFTFENICLLKDNERSELQLRSIEKIFKIINSSFRDSELIEAVLSEIGDIAPYDTALVLTVDRYKANHLKVVEMMAKDSSSFSKGDHFDCTGTLVESAMKQGTTQIVNDTQAMPAGSDGENAEQSRKLEHLLFASEKCRSCLFTPLRTDGIVTGVLILLSEKPGVFADLKNLIEWIANGLSIAIERNKLSDSVLKRNQELETIKQIGSALASSTFDINKVLKYTMDMVRMLMNVEAGSLLFLEDDELELAVAFNTKLKSMKKFKLKIGQGIAGYAAARGEPIIVNNIGRSPHFYPGVDKHTGFVTRSVLCVPMISQGKVIGVIEVLNKTSGEFTPNDEDLLQSIAASVSIAIVNARLYKETVSMADHERGLRRMFQKFVPKQVLDNIIHSEQDGAVGVDEVKRVSLLNIDIRGFTEIAMEMGPQKTVALLNSFFNVMGDIVFQHNGIVDKYLGDGFLAVFGAPASTSKDATNAAAAALDMKNAVGEINKKLLKEHGESISVGISVHTGDVVVGNIGFDKKMDYTVIGDAVNTVFRLQELTRSYPNGIIIGETTRRSSMTHLEVRDINNALGELKLYELTGMAPN
jgi:GAF domain-containing protein